MVCRLRPFWYIQVWFDDIVTKIVATYNTKRGLIQLIWSLIFFVTHVTYSSLGLNEQPMQIDEHYQKIRNRVYSNDWVT